MMLDTVQRGEHSTGIFVTSYKNPKAMPTGVKVVGGPHNIYANKPVWDELSDYIGNQGGAIVGHGRLATKGKISSKNAHPFQYGHITLVHNGTLTGGVSFAKKGETEIEVDSHALAVSMAEKGMMETLATIKGAYAIIAHDAKEGCLWIARNSERPLHVYSSEGRHLIMSEKEYLDALIDKQNMRKHDTHVMHFISEKLIKIDLKNPRDYILAGDIKEVREAKEKILREEARALRLEAERLEAEDRKNNPDKYKPRVTWKEGNPTGQAGMLPKSTKQAHHPKKVSFVVKEIKPFKALWLYECDMLSGGSRVHFMSDVRKESYIGMTGTADVHTVHEKGMFTDFFVKHRGIEWFEHEQVETIKPEDRPDAGKEEGAPITGGMFLTYNNKRIAIADWKDRIAHNGCHMCDRTFVLLDYKKTVLMSDNNLLCDECNRKLNVYNPKTDALPPQQEILH